MQSEFEPNLPPTTGTGESSSDPFGETRPRESNQSLVLLCLQGDASAWRRLVERYGTLVYSTALQVGLPAEDARDVFQEVWIELHRSLPRIENPEALAKWLMVATRRLCYKVAARGRRMLPEISPELADAGPLPDDLYHATESRLILEEAMSRLDETCARLLQVLFFELDRPSYDEIAARMGWRIGSVGPIRGRCLDRLRRLLEESNG
ncbi:MAG: sigma-70 family RNA polymerase sigma factor [Candidatus Eisenbacteria bacterium]|nr:sigma-70 family RNA polymerase sigma factor [Candidatus Eisenbacteria bacterium]MCC7142652.1 sigma-70 family RNA polymerase sigma factor [Candidatus Eisenbacteria bacterium]